MKQEDDFIRRWLEVLTPVYGEREARNIWKWYSEAEYDPDSFETDLARLAAHYPVQYLLGYTWFYGRKIFVNEHTLIPRPETEELVYHVLERAGSLKNARVIDLGTGTGCIPVTLAAMRPSWEVTGVDIHRGALETARKNADFHGVNIRWAEADLLAWTEFPVLQESYDLIISNPPYIPDRDRVIMEENVLKYEPEIALFAPDEEGLIFYRMMADHASESLKAGGRLFLELHEDHAAEISAVFQRAGKYQQPEILQDMQGKDRILIVRKR